MDSPTTTEATSSSSPSISHSFFAKLTAACVGFLIGLKHDAVQALVGILPTIEDAGASFVAAEIEKLLHALSGLPMGTEIVKLAEGWSVKVIGNGLPRHGAAADLLGAIEEALGLPSHISTAPPTPAPEPALEEPVASPFVVHATTASSVPIVEAPATVTGIDAPATETVEAPAEAAAAPTAVE